MANNEIKFYQTIGFWIGVAVTILSAAALIDRYLNTLILTTWHNDILVYIRLNAAFGHLLSGLFLVIYSFPRNKTGKAVLWILALAVFFIGFLTFVEFVFGVDLGIDQLLGSEKPGGVWSLFTTRMAFAATVAFMLLGGSYLLFLASPFLGIFIAEIFGMFTSLIGITALFSIGLSHIPFLKLFGFGVSFPYMAVILAVLFIFSGIGAWFNDRPVRRSFFGIAAKFFLFQSLIIFIAFLFMAYVDGQQIYGGTPMKAESFLVIQNQFQRTGFLFLFIILASLVNLWALRKSIIEPIEQLSAAAKKIAAEKYRTVLPVSRYNAEIGDLYAAVQTMADSLLGKVKELEYVNWIKSGFISTASDQLLIPLLTMRQTVSALMDASGNMNEVQRGDIMVIREINEKMINLVYDLLNTSSVEEKKINAKIETVDLDELLGKHINSFEIVARKRKIKYLFKASAKTANIDPKFLEHAFYNILDNAIKYGEAGSDILVTVDAADEGKNFLISVFDKGPKIPEQEQLRVFTKFYRGEEARRIFPEGSGLGLAIAKMAVEANGGKIWFESNDAGTTFYFTIPIWEPERK